MPNLGVALGVCEMIHSTLLINKAGGLIYNKDFTTALNKLSSNESLVLDSTAIILGRCEMDPCGVQQA